MLVGAGLRTIGSPFSAVMVVIAAGAGTATLPSCSPPLGFRMIVSPWRSTVWVDVGLNLIVDPLIDSCAGAEVIGRGDALSVDATEVYNLEEFDVGKGEVAEKPGLKSADPVLAGSRD